MTPMEREDLEQITSVTEKGQVHTLAGLARRLDRKARRRTGVTFTTRRVAYIPSERMRSQTTLLIAMLNL